MNTVVIKIENKYASIKWISKNIRGSILSVVILSLISVFVSYFAVQFALVSKDLLDYAVNGEKGMLSKSVIELVILVLIQLTLHIVSTVLSISADGRIRNRLQKNLFSSLLYKDWSQLKGYHSGEYLNRLNGDIACIGSTLITLLPSVIALVSKLVLSFFELYRLDSDFALIFLIIGPVVMIIARIYSTKMKPLHKKCLETQGETHSFMLEALRNILVVKSFGAHERITGIVGNIQEKFYRLIMKRGYISLVARILFFVFITIGYYFSVVWCAYKISIGIMTVGTFAAIVQLVGQVQAPFKELAGVLPKYYAFIASVERVEEIENLIDEKEAVSREEADRIYGSMSEIKAENMSFSYENENIFDSASFTIEKNTLVAISGRSGIGKSTLLKIILGIIHPEEGSVTAVVDGKELEVDSSLRSLFAYVPQGNMILSGTIRDNITFLNSDISDEDVVSAAKTACIWDAICDMPAGLDTVLGEGGSGLSEGQIQRIAVARAVCSKAPVLLLDEATSALDEATERNMLENIIALKNRTCIIISHKDCAFEKCDKMLTISSGKIVES